MSFGYKKNWVKRVQFKEAFFHSSREQLFPNKYSQTFLWQTHTFPEEMSPIRGYPLYRVLDIFKEKMFIDKNLTIFYVNCDSLQLAIPIDYFFHGDNRLLNGLRNLAKAPMSRWKNEWSNLWSLFIYYFLFKSCTCLIIVSWFA